MIDDRFGDLRHCLSMTTGTRTQATFIQGNQSAMEHDASQSALHYLFQEVSKLASPIHNSFLDTSSTSTWLNETSGQGDFLVKKEEEYAPLFQMTDGICQHSVPHVSPYHQMKRQREESHSSMVTTMVEAPPQRTSPWKVLSLINLHCDRLLQHSDEESFDPTSVSSSAKLDHSIDKASTATADVTYKGAGRDNVSVERTLSTSSRKPQCCVKDSKLSCFVRSQTSVKTGIVRAELVKENAATFSKPHNEDKREFKCRLSEWNQQCEKNCFSSKQETLSVHFSENALSQTHIPNASLSTQLTCNANEDASVALSKPALTLDHNANFALATDPQIDTHLLPPSCVLPSAQLVSLYCSNTENGPSLSKQDDKITSSEQEGTVEENCPPLKQLKSSMYNGEFNFSLSGTAEPRPVTEEIPPHNQQWRTKTPRKQPHPSRSVNIQEPGFKGVAFRMDTELDHNRDQCRLLITSTFSKDLCKSVRKPKLRTRTSQKTLKTSSSEEESDLKTNGAKGKVCASCCTMKTPMWRDAEDGTPLCNACGIRYKKYRVRCVNCWHIPRKEGNSNSCCLKCGKFVGLTSAQRKQTT